MFPPMLFLIQDSTQLLVHVRHNLYSPLLQVKVREATRNEVGCADTDLLMEVAGKR